MIWILVFESLTWDNFKFSAKTECIVPSMIYYVQSELILFANALWERVKPDRADIKNGEKALKLRRSYKKASKYALILQLMKMSLGFGNIWGHLSYVLSHSCLKFDFRFVASSVSIRVKTVVCNVPQPISGRYCVGFSFFPSLFFLLLRQNYWRKWIEF